MSNFITVGFGGARRNAAVAVCQNGRVVAACEQERLTRTREQGIVASGLPREALNVVLRTAGLLASDVDAWGCAEDGICLRERLRLQRVPHHEAHATHTYQTSPFSEAVVVVCATDEAPAVSVWRADANGIHEIDGLWKNLDFSSVYSRLVVAAGLTPRRDEHRFEALARASSHSSAQSGSPVSIRDDRLCVTPDRNALWSSFSDTSLYGARAGAANAVQSQFADAFIELLRRVRDNVMLPNVCLSGGLFHNTYLNTRVAGSGVFENVFVPVHPGNAGLAVGCALWLSQQSAPSPLEPFLGPEYDPGEVKAVLDNCKLSYDYLGDEELIEQTVRTLQTNRLVGWFQGRMEWGPGALGNRSILANPLSPYVLENLNTFLKGRELYRSYAVSVCEEDCHQYFAGPPRSSAMQYEYTVRRPDLFSSLMPGDGVRLRIHTVGANPPMFRRLLKRFGELAGAPVLVNTSFNGFHEPIVCTPRDAVRVFYGTGLDALVIGNFFLRK